MKILIVALLSVTALLAALVVLARRPRHGGCVAAALLDDAARTLLSSVAADTQQAASIRSALDGCDGTLLLTFLCQTGIQFEQTGPPLPPRFWQLLYEASVKLNHEDWPELLAKRMSQ